MRVGLVCPYSLDVHGGVQNHVLDLADALRRLGHRVAVLAPGEGRRPLPTYVTTTGRTLPMPYNGSVARVSFGPVVAARVRRWLETSDFDVVHLHEPATPSLSVIALWAARGPVVATFHTAQRSSRVLQTSAATLLRSGLAKIDAHIAVSEEARTTMARYLGGVDPVLIPNGVRTDRFGGDRGQAGPGEPDFSGPTLLFLGRLDEARKGLTVLLQALPAVLSRHPSARLEVVGRGWGRQTLRLLPPEARSRVRVWGPLDDAGKVDALARADVLVAPNTGGESFGIVLLEAMAAGTPVVASDLPAFRRVLAEGRRGVLFPTGDAAALAERLVGLLDDAPRREALARRARTGIGRFDWSTVAPQVLSVYAEAAARDRRPGRVAGPAA